MEDSLSKETIEEFQNSDYRSSFPQCASGLFRAIYFTICVGVGDRNLGGKGAP